MMKRRSVFAATACVAVLVVAAACSGGGKGGGFSTGEYTVSLDTPGANGCNFASLLDGAKLQAYVSATSAEIAGATGSITGSTITLAKSHTDDQRARASLFCQLDFTATFTGTVTGKDAADITLTRGEANPVGGDCALFTSQAGIATLPCTTTETFHISKTGPATPPQPKPTPLGITGTLTSLDSGVAPFVSYANSTAQGLALTWDATLGGESTGETSAAWYCGNATAANPNYTHFDAAHRLLLVMTTAGWIAGTHAMDPNAIFVQVLDSNFAATGASGSTGSMVIASAGTLADDPASLCRFTLSGVTLNGTAPAPMPLLARPSDALARERFRLR